MAKPKTKKERERIASLLQEATVDCYDQEEERMGLLTMIESNVECPFTAKVIGEDVVVNSLVMSESSDSLFAVCERNGRKHSINIDSLEWVKPLPEGFEWIKAYFAWRDGDY